VCSWGQAVPIGPLDRRMFLTEVSDSELSYTGRQNIITGASLYLSPPPRGQASDGSHVTISLILIYVPCRRTRVQNLSKKDLAGLPRAGKHKAHARPQQEGGERTPRREPRPSTHAPPAPGQLPRTQPASFCRYWRTTIRINGPINEKRQPGGGKDRPLPPPPTEPRIRHKTTATRTK